MKTKETYTNGFVFTTGGASFSLQPGLQARVFLEEAAHALVRAASRLFSMPVPTPPLCQ